MKGQRRWHRITGTIAVIFLSWAAVTGVIVACTEFFGADEAERERVRDMTSTVKLEATDPTAAKALSLALVGAMAKAPGAPVDRIELKVKGDKPTVAIFLGKVGGGEDKQLVFDANTGAFLKEDDYEDKPLVYRLHSGEAFGDGGLVAGMLWGLGLAVMCFTGFRMYLHMLGRRHETGWRKYFW